MKIMISKKILCYVAGMAFPLSLNAKTISANSGNIPDTTIQYTATLDIGKRGLQMKFTFLNESEKEYHLWEPSIGIPGYTSLFFSTDKTPMISSNNDWASEYIPGGEPRLMTHTIKSGSSVEIWLPIGVFYDKIYRKAMEDNVYIYWGVTMMVANYNSSFIKKGEIPPKLAYTPLPRIGGMLTLPKGTKIKD
jgi:hypothetical protein